jgi:tetratricopeptide (TPR) repeat protein
VTKLGTSAASVVRVECVTCHRGQPRPRLLEDLLAETLENDGVEAATAKYRKLRKQFYGSHTFDFRPRVLDGLAEGLAGSGQLDAALAMLELNAEMHPNYAMARYLIGEVQLRQGNTQRATASFEKALELNPQHRRARQRLAELKGEK